MNFIHTASIPVIKLLVDTSKFEGYDMDYKIKVDLTCGFTD